MHITWHGLHCIKLQTDTATLLIDPYQDSVGNTMPKLKVDIAASSNMDDVESNNVERLQGDPKKILGPGEYEISNVFTYGIPYHQRTLYVVDTEGITLGHPGNALPTLTDAQLELFEGIDVLFLPITGSDAKKRAEFISQVEPRIIIPMHYQTPKMKVKLDSLDVFAKEMGIQNSAGEKKVIVKKNTLPVEETQVVILQPV